jgi:hypothetical protein
MVEIDKVLKWVLHAEENRRVYVQVNFDDWKCKDVHSKTRFRSRNNYKSQFMAFYINTLHIANDSQHCCLLTSTEQQMLLSELLARKSG